MMSLQVPTFLQQTKRQFHGFPEVKQIVSAQFSISLKNLNKKTTKSNTKQQSNLKINFSKITIITTPVFHKKKKERKKVV